MRHRLCTRVALAAALSTFAFAPALADGVIAITQEKALAGNITPGDDPGFPVQLSRAGSYRLASNLVVPAGKTGIKINAPDISIDLNGFSILGKGVARDGIAGSADGATISNGTIERFAQEAIEGFGDFWIIRDMRIVGNAGFAGIRCGRACHVEGSIVAGNDAGGIRTDSGAVIGNVISNNTGQGLASGGAGFGNNALILNAGNKAGNVLRMDPNMCRSASTLGFC
jgi:hypothetical protein